jgi:hypothetical protein
LIGFDERKKRSRHFIVLNRRGSSTMLAGSIVPPAISKHGELDHSHVVRPFRQTISSHGLNRWPVLSKKGRRVVHVGRLHLDAASLSSAVVRYLKMERVGCCLRIFVARSAFAAH